MKNNNHSHWILRKIVEDQSPEKTITLWPQIETRLASKGKIHPSETPIGVLKGKFSLKKAVYYTTIVLLLTVVGSLSLVLSVRAQVSDWITGQANEFSFFTPHSQVQVGLFSDGSLGFVPLSPTYLPKGDWVMIPDTYTEEVSHLKTLKLTYNKDNQFVILSERENLPEESLPKGEIVKVKNQPAVLFTGLSGEVNASIDLSENGEVQPEPSGLVNLGPVQYSNGVWLIWQSGEIRLEILSNLTAKQVLKIANSMHPVEVLPAQMEILKP